jgi:phage gpG-like protein
MNKFNFDEISARFEKVKIELPKIIANDTKNYFVESFNKQQWDGKAWEPRKDKKDEGRKLLVKSARLRNDLINSNKSATWQSIKFTIDNPYAQVHNDGLKSGRGSGFTMPKRQFVGHTKELTKRQLNKIKSYMKRVWQQ